MTTAQDIADKLLSGVTLCEGEIFLDLPGYKIAVQSNSDTLLEKLGIYFAHTLGAGEADTTVIAIDGDAPELGIDFIDWKREPGKSGRKDAYHELTDGRLVQKVRTGMVFLQSREHVIASGPSLENDNQVINFINAQYMNHLQQTGSLICHASGLVKEGQCLGMAGFSGGGKSTLMLKMMEEAGISYLTNDRLFLKNEDDRITGTGIPKLPRINPGTIINNPTLAPMLSKDRTAELNALPLAELWDLEEKYDVFVEDVYGDNKITPNATLNAFLVLNWKRDSAAPCTIKEVDLNERKDLLGAIMKSPGPFYQYPDGRFLADDEELAAAPYLDHLKSITIFEATGKVDFDQASDFCLTHLGK